MTESSVLSWFEEIAAAARARAEGGASQGTYAQLLAEMQSALWAAFPPAHAIRVRWQEDRRRAVKGQRADLAVPESWTIEDGTPQEGNLVLAGIRQFVARTDGR